MSRITFQELSDYRALSEDVSERLLALIQRKPNAVICLATGATPAAGLSNVC
ncbi:galactosamine-6-phosphate isomerase [Raoultella terrigena]|uniref:Galactosamine-6-phosphate isomerase n=1 Tax=Raoultella terrigena TaxID=577 RepID=A0A3P8JMC9_RAOTE|nr:galactosamine-6-phosphate isomerase [Raoultella terrigena]